MTKEYDFVSDIRGAINGCSSFILGKFFYCAVFMPQTVRSTCIWTKYQDYSTQFYSDGD